MPRARGHRIVPSSGAAAVPLLRPPAHRAIRRFPVSASGLAISLVMAGAFNGLTWSLRSFIGGAWAELFEFWTRKLELGATVSLPGAGGRWLEAALPAIDIVSRAPGRSDWRAILIITAFILVVAHYLPDRLLPLRYLARFVCMVQGTALFYFAVAPGPFPYELAGYSHSMGQSLLWLMVIVPWIHALTYGIFAFSIPRKIALTALTLGFVGVAGPFLVMAHVYLIARLSLLVVPVLFFVFGMPLLVFACIGLYGWAMSWKRCGAAAPPVPGGASGA